MRAIVTVKFPNNPKHNPQSKQSGNCRVSIYCTDVTGSHHSYLAVGETLDAIHEEATKEFGHVTRIERVPESDEYTAFLGYIINNPVPETVNISILGDTPKHMIEFSSFMVWRQGLHKQLQRVVHSREFEEETKIE